MAIEVYTNSDNQLVVDTLTIAREFGKEHKNVTRDFVDEINALKIEPVNFTWSDEYFYIKKSSYLDSKGEPRAKYEVNEAMMNIVVLAYTGDEAHTHRVNFIKAFMDMRNGKELSVEYNTVDFKKQPRYKWEWNGKMFDSSIELARMLGVRDNYPAMYASQGTKLKGYPVIRHELPN